MTGSLSLDDISKRYRMLEVRCGNCPRSGRLSIDKVILERHREVIEREAQPEMRL